MRTDVQDRSIVLVSMGMQVVLYARMTIFKLSVHILVSTTRRQVQKGLFDIVD